MKVMRRVRRWAGVLMMIAAMSAVSQNIGLNINSVDVSRLLQSGFNLQVTTTKALASTEPMALWLNNDTTSAWVVGTEGASKSQAVLTIDHQGPAFSNNDFDFEAAPIRKAETGTMPGTGSCNKFTATAVSGGLRVSFGGLLKIAFTKVTVCKQKPNNPREPGLTCADASATVPVADRDAIEANKAVFGFSRSVSRSLSRSSSLALSGFNTQNQQSQRKLLLVPSIAASLTRRRPTRRRPTRRRRYTAPVSTDCSQTHQFCCVVKKLVTHCKLGDVDCGEAPMQVAGMMI